MARLTSRWLLRGGIGDLGLTKVEALVLLALLDHVGKDGIAWCPQTHLARHLRVSRSRIVEVQAQLRDRGLLIEHEPGRQGRATRYRFGTVGAEHVHSSDMSDAANMSDHRGNFKVVNMSDYRT
ncbi:helix-turn-helix domain-containing protein [uncultured Microbacterium sp.]|uniref:helix-turn-helix domain-containing protein n=1 Tax=uncultured Microbacterium sp. TaxID=191216 RepID=UPI0028D5FFAE|nr:helix-turn-helix domain-containing protein [uncultured Microbacterium sp.]